MFFLAASLNVSLLCTAALWGPSWVIAGNRDIVPQVMYKAQLSGEPPQFSNFSLQVGPTPVNILGLAIVSLRPGHWESLCSIFPDSFVWLHWVTKVSDPKSFLPFPFYYK